jgi:hypothetical protein
MDLFSFEKNIEFTNIMKGFKIISIWPFNLQNMEGKMQPSQQFVHMETLEAPRWTSK